MKRKIKNDYSLIKNIFNKENLFYLLLCIIGLNSYCILNTIKKYNMSLNLVFDLSGKYYIILLLLTCLFFSFIILNTYKNRPELITRFSNKENFFSFLFKKIFLIVTFIYFLEISVLFIFRLFYYHFYISSELYIFYNISSFIYFFWEIVRNYIYVIFIVYFITYIYFFSKNKNSTYVAIFFIIFSLFFPLKSFKYVIFTYFTSFRDFGSFSNEIAIFLASYIIKYYLIINILKLIISFNFNKLKELFYKIIYYLKYSYIPLILYILINVINIYFLKNNKMDFDILNIICYKSFKEQSLISTATKGISILSFILFILRNYSLDVNKNYCLIFTRISKKTWVKKKILVTFLIILILRMPIYFLSSINYIFILDFIIYFLLGFMSIIYLLNSTNINLIIIIGYLSLFFLLPVYQIKYIITLLLLFIIYFLANLYVYFNNINIKHKN